MITYTSRADDSTQQIDYSFSDGLEVTLLMDAPEMTAIYMDKSTGDVRISGTEELDTKRAESLHTTHTIRCRNPDGTPYFETFTINNTIPPRFEELA